MSKVSALLLQSSLLQGQSPTTKKANHFFGPYSLSAFVFKAIYSSTSEFVLVFYSVLTKKTTQSHYAGFLNMAVFSRPRPIPICYKFLLGVSLWLSNKIVEGKGL